jgi:hypothetical protein
MTIDLVARLIPYHPRSPLEMLPGCGRRAFGTGAGQHGAVSSDSLAEAEMGHEIASSGE